MPKVITMGELLVDFIPYYKDCKLKDVKKFSRAAGGAPANVAAALARVNVSSGFIGKVGKDAFGDFLIEVMEDQGVNTSAIVRTSAAMTTLAFVSLTAEGERDFAFYRRPGADMLLEKDDIDVDYLTRADVFHFGTISLTDEPVRSTTYYLLEKARENGLFISFDPNIRPPLWNNNLSRLKVQFNKSLPYADLVKLNLEELIELSDREITTRDLSRAKDYKNIIASLKPACESLLKRGPDYIVLTAGKKGSYFFNKNEQLYVSAREVEAVDTTGAGDAFMAGMLAEIIGHISGETMEDINWEQVLEKANLFGAIASSRYGAIPSLPTLEELKSPPI